MNRVIDRLDIYMKFRGLNDNKITSACNLSIGLIGKARRINSDLGRNSIEKILNFYTELNPEWLKYGHGEMIKSESPLIASEPNTIYQTENGSKFVLLLPLSAQAGSLNDFIVGIKDTDCEKIISPIKGVDFAITVTGDSMAPEYPSGTQVFIKKINEKAFIDWGRTYVLDTCNGIVLKRIVPGSVEGNIKCISINPDPLFAPFEVSLKDVFGIYRVLLSMSVK